MDWNKKSISILVLVLLALVGGAVTTAILLRKKSSETPILSPKWQVGQWVPNVADCKTCGTCVQNRTVKCVAGDSSLPEAKCTDPKPTVTQTVDAPSCVYTWSEGGTWDDSACKELNGKPKPCGTFSETKWGVHCQDQFGNIVADELCIGPKPDKKDCGLPECTYSWKTDDWILPVSPYVCGTTQINREVFCISDQDGGIVADHYCSGEKPTTTRIYPSSDYPDDKPFRACTNGWIVQSDWGPKDCKNSAPCGSGEQTRNVVCYASGEVVNPFSPAGQASCPAGQVPVSKQTCDTGINCDCCGVVKPTPPNYCSCDWDVPAPKCPEFWKTTVNLDVQCKNQDKSKIVLENNCTKPKPATNYICNPDSIDIDRFFAIQDVSGQYIGYNAEWISDIYYKIGDIPMPLKLFYKADTDTYGLYFNFFSYNYYLCRIKSDTLNMMKLVWAKYYPGNVPTDSNYYWNLNQNGSYWNLITPEDPNTTVRLINKEFVVCNSAVAQGTPTANLLFVSNQS